MADMRITRELDCLERALDEKIDYFRTQNKEMTREEIANTLELMKADLMVHLRHIFN
mgnify:CR=1 FL=1